MWAHSQLICNYYNKVQLLQAMKNWRWKKPSASYQGFAFFSTSICSSFPGGKAGMNWSLSRALQCSRIPSMATGVTDSCLGVPDSLGSCWLVDCCLERYFSAGWLWEEGSSEVENWLESFLGVVYKFGHSFCINWTKVPDTYYLFIPVSISTHIWHCIYIYQFSDVTIILLLATYSICLPVHLPCTYLPIHISIHLATYPLIYLLSTI